MGTDIFTRVLFEGPFAKFKRYFGILVTVVTSRLAPQTVDWPPLFAMYYLPYENGKWEKLDLFSDGCRWSFKRITIKGP